MGKPRVLHGRIRLGKCLVLFKNHLQYVKTEECVPRRGIIREKRTLWVCESMQWREWRLYDFMFAGLMEESQLSEV